MTTSVLEEEEPGITDCDFGDARVWDDVCKAGESRPRPKATFRKMLVFSICGSVRSVLGLSFSFPLVVLANAASSSTMCGVGGSFLDCVAVRRLCSNVDQNFLKVFEDDSTASLTGPDEVEGL